MAEQGSRIDIPGIPYMLKPLHRGKINDVPAFVTSSTNGKGAFARSCGIPVVQMPPDIAASMARHEEQYQAELGVDVIGPTMVDGLPISLLTAIKKMKGADPLPGDIYASDAHYTVRLPGGGGFSIHQPRNRAGRETLIRNMQQASQIEGTQLITEVGIVRRHPDGELELFTAQTNLGMLQPLRADTLAIIEQRLIAKPTIAMGTPTLDVFGLFVREHGPIQTELRRYTHPNSGTPGDIIFGCISPDPRHESIVFPSDNKQTVHQFGLGFIT